MKRCGGDVRHRNAANGECETDRVITEKGAFEEGGQTPNAAGEPYADRFLDESDIIRRIAASSLLGSTTRSAK